MIAGNLTPDRQGFGTHQQLGLPPCTIQDKFGFRCPACGMTTSWAHFVRGQWVSALSCSVAGTMLALISALMAPWWIATAIYGEWVWIRPNDCTVIVFCVTIMAVTLTDWLARLVMEHI